MKNGDNGMDINEDLIILVEKENQINAAMKELETDIIENEKIFNFLMQVNDFNKGITGVSLKLLRILEDQQSFIYNLCVYFLNEPDKGLDMIKRCLEDIRPTEEQIRK